DFERILAHRINCQRATASLSSRVASKQLSKYRHGRQDCQHLEIRNSNISTTVHPLPLSRLKSMRCEPTVQSSAIFAKDCRAAILTTSLGQRKPAMPIAKRRQAGCFLSASARPARTWGLPSVPLPVRTYIIQNSENPAARISDRIRNRVSSTRIPLLGNGVFREPPQVRFTFSYRRMSTHRLLLVFLYLRLIIVFGRNLCFRIAETICQQRKRCVNPR